VTRPEVWNKKKKILTVLNLAHWRSKQERLKLPRREMLLKQLLHSPGVSPTPVDFLFCADFCIKVKGGTSMLNFPGDRGSMSAAFSFFVNPRGVSTGASSELQQVRGH
jgi:hypothetical protein